MFDHPHDLPVKTNSPKINRERKSRFVGVGIKSVTFPRKFARVRNAKSRKKNGDHEAKNLHYGVVKIPSLSRKIVAAKRAIPISVKPKLCNRLADGGLI